MKLLKQAAVAVFMVATLATPAVTVSAADDLVDLYEQIQLDYEVFTLANGLTVLVYPDHRKPQVRVTVLNRVGSKDEPAGKTGFAHFYEHLMFQGTENAPGDYAERIREIGATGMNGTTSADRTNYYETVPTGALDAILWLESDRMANITTGVTQEILDEQRAVVKNEKRQLELRPGSGFMDFVRENFYPTDHPYHHDTIGSMDDLNAASLQDVHQWYKDYYGATNTILVLSGDIDVATAKEKVTHYFSDVPAGKRINEINEYIPTLDTTKYLTYYDKIPNTSVTRVYPLASNKSKDVHLLSYMAPTIAGNDEAILDKLLKEELEYVTDVSIRINPAMVSSSISIEYTMDPSANVTSEQIDKIIDEQLQKFFKDGPDKDALAREHLNDEADFIRSADNADGIANLLASGILNYGDPEFFRKVRKWQIETSTKELKQVAQKWLDQPYLQVVSKPYPEASTMSASVDRSSIPAVSETTSEVKVPELQTASLDNGMELVLLEDDKLPMVDFTFVFETGSAADHQYNRGTAGQTFNLLTKGTKKYDKNELTKAQQQIATTINLRPGGRQSNLSFNTLTPYVDDSVKLVAEVLKNPSFPQAEIEELKQQIEQDYKRRYSRPGASAGQLFEVALWGKEHERGTMLSLEQQLDNVSREQMVKFHQNELGPNNTTVYISGAISMPEARQLLNKHFGEWKKADPTEEPEQAAPEGLKGKIILVNSPGTPSASVTLGQLIAPWKAEQEDALAIVNGVLGEGLTSRLARNLRETKGWTYGIRSGIAKSSKGLQKFSISSNIQNDKVAPALQEIYKELTGYIGDNAITQTELDEYRDSKLKTYPMGFGRPAVYLSAKQSLALYGLDVEYVEGYQERMNSITLDQLHNLAKDTIKPDEMVWVIAGDLSIIEDDIRALNLAEVEVWDDKGNRIR